MKSRGCWLIIPLYLEWRLFVASSLTLFHHCVLNVFYVCMWWGKTYMGSDNLFLVLYLDHITQKFGTLHWMWQIDEVWCCLSWEAHTGVLYSEDLWGLLYRLVTFTCPASFSLLLQKEMFPTDRLPHHLVCPSPLRRYAHDSRWSMRIDHHPGLDNVFMVKCLLKQGKSNSYLGILMNPERQFHFFCDPQC